MKIIIIGGKGTAVNIGDSIVNAQKIHGMDIELLGYCIDDVSLGETINDAPILCNTSQILKKFDKYPDVKFIFSLYKPEEMKERINLLSSYGISKEKFCNFIHPTAYISDNVQLGLGNVILSHCSVQSNVTIGNYNIINSNVVIEHDTKIGNNNFISAKACIGSEVEIQNGVFVGLNSSFREKVVIKNYAFVGIASNVLSNVGENTLVYGNPAKEK